MDETWTGPGHGKTGLQLQKKTTKKKNCIFQIFYFINKNEAEINYLCAQDKQQKQQQQKPTMGGQAKYQESTVP